MKRIETGCLFLLIVFIGITGVPSKTAYTGWGTENTIGLSTESSKHVDNGSRITNNTGDYEYTINEDGTAKIIQYLKEEDNVKIPDVLDGHSVTVIGKEAFDFKSSITSIQIPNTVTVIEERAFSRIGVKEMILPESVLKIGERAFWCCEALEWIYISKNVEEIEGNITESSGKLTQIDVDFRNPYYTSMDGILYNKDMTELLAVPGSKEMTRFRLPDSVVCIGERAFFRCANGSFTEITIPDQVTVLGADAFAYCRNLEKVVLGKNITKIPDGAFLATGVSDVAIHGKLTEIGQWAFCDCYSLSKVPIPDGVTKIGKIAFYNCGLLKDITIPKSVTEIGYKAIGYADDCDGRIRGISITGYRGTAAYQYAKRVLIAFQDAETGENIRFDLVSAPIPRERITALTAGKKKIRLEYHAEEEASYQIAVRKVGAPSWKKYGETKPWAVIKGLKSGKQYKVKVRALREIEGEEYYGKWSKVKKVTVGSGVKRRK